MFYLLLWVLLLLGVVPVLAGPTTNTRGTTDTWLTISTAVANGAGVVSASLFTPTSAGYQFAECEFNGPSWSGTIAAQGAMTLWICTEVDGTNTTDCDTTNFSTKRPDAVFPLRAANAAQRILQTVVMPPGPFKALLRNESGVSLNGNTSTATLKCKPYTPQTSDAGAGSSQQLQLVSTGTNPFSLFTLPAAGSTSLGTEYLVLKADTTLGDVRILPAGSDTLNGTTAFVWTNQPYSGFRVTLVSATNWFAEPVNPLWRAEDLANGVTGEGLQVLNRSPLLHGGTNMTMALTTNGHVEYQAPASPTVTTGAADCGTSPSVSGNDVQGKVTVGTSTNGGKCTLTFAQAYSQPVLCHCQNNSAAQLCRALNGTTTAVELTGTLAAGNVLQYACSTNF